MWLTSAPWSGRNADDSSRKRANFPYSTWLVSLTHRQIGGRSHGVKDPMAEIRNEYKTPHGASGFKRLTNRSAWDQNRYL